MNTYVMCVHTGHSENKRLRKPTKRLLESIEEYEQIFVPKKKSKKHTSESSKMVSFLTLLLKVKSSNWCIYDLSFIHLVLEYSVFRKNTHFYKL